MTGGVAEHRTSSSLVLVVVVALGAILLGGCNDEPAAVEPPTPSRSPATSPTESSSPSGPTSPSASLPLSPLEDNVGVQALRRYYDGVARAIDSWDFTVPELTENAGPELLAALPDRVAVEKGRDVPGPVPFTPVELVEDSDTRKVITLCGLDDGWSREAGTDTPAAARNVVPLTATVVPVEGRWIVTEMLNAPDAFDCSTVTIQEVYF